MSNDNIDIIQLRKTWAEMGKALGMQPISGNNPQDLDKKKTALDRLRERYRTFGMISAVMILAGFLIFSKGMLHVSSLNLWLGVAYAVYFLTASCMDFWLCWRLGSIDPLRMSVVEIAEKSILCRKRHLQFMAVLIPMVIALLGFTSYVYSYEVYFLYGMIVGVILGAIIGILQFRRFMAEYRRLSD